MVSDERPNLNSVREDLEKGDNRQCQDVTHYSVLYAISYNPHHFDI